MRHELSAVLGGREVAVTVERARDGQWRVAVDGGPERPLRHPASGATRP